MVDPGRVLVRLCECGLIGDAIEVENDKVRPVAFANLAPVGEAHDAGRQRGLRADRRLQREGPGSKRVVPDLAGKGAVETRMDGTVAGPRDAAVRGGRHPGLRCVVLHIGLRHREPPEASAARPVAVALQLQRDRRFHRVLSPLGRDLAQVLPHVRFVEVLEDHDPVGPAPAPDLVRDVGADQSGRLGVAQPLFEHVGGWAGVLAPRSRLVVESPARDQDRASVGAAGRVGVLVRPHSDPLVAGLPDQLDRRRALPPVAHPLRLDVRGHDAHTRAAPDLDGLRDGVLQRGRLLLVLAGQVPHRVRPLGPLVRDVHSVVGCEFGDQGDQFLGGAPPSRDVLQPGRHPHRPLLQRLAHQRQGLPVPSRILPPRMSTLKCSACWVVTGGVGVSTAKRAARAIRVIAANPPDPGSHG